MVAIKKEMVRKQLRSGIISIIKSQLDT